MLRHAVPLRFRLHGVRGRGRAPTPDSEHLVPLSIGCRAMLGAVFQADVPNRRSIRLRDYDCAAAGPYFVTLCAYRGRSLFGQFANGRIVVTPVGQIVQSCWDQISSHFPGVTIDAYVIMPNHFHGILLIHEPGTAPKDTSGEEGAGTACRAPASAAEEEVSFAPILHEGRTREDFASPVSRSLPTIRRSLKSAVIPSGRSSMIPDRIVIEVTAQSTGLLVWRATLNGETAVSLQGQRRLAWHRSSPRREQHHPRIRPFQRLCGRRDNSSDMSQCAVGVGAELAEEKGRSRFLNLRSESLSLRIQAVRSWEKVLDRPIGFAIGEFEFRGGRRSGRGDRPKRLLAKGPQMHLLPLSVTTDGSASVQTDHYPTDA